MLLGGNTRAFDCLVGYFYLSGFRRLADALQQTEKIRVLIGLSTDRPTYELLSQAKEQIHLNLRSHAEAKEAVPGEILSELEHAADSADVEDGVRQFIEWVKSGKLQVRVYPSAKLHAKLYVMSFVKGHIDKGRVITGSSNFSQSGLVDNLEFNVELKNRSDYDFALEKFNELWEQAVEVSDAYVQTVELRSPFAQFTPHELYLKFLYEYFKAELSRGEETDSVYLPVRFKKLKYQDDAVMAARRTLDEYGGVFLSDVVGLGKTYMAALLAQQLPGRTLVIAPPALLDENNPGSWPNVFHDFRVPQARFQSGGKLDELIRQGVERYDNVFIDESHRFRTETNQTYERLAQICRGKRVILVSATPLNNHPHDILSQVKLFQNGKASTLPGLRDLEAFFGALVKRLKGLDRQNDREDYFAAVRENAREIRERVLKYLMIRRTRTEIARYYTADLAAQNLRFPDVAAPEPLYYQLNYSRFLNEARLTSLAIALYLAGLKLSPAKDYRLLVLDDILIGLDMVNRVKMLELIHEHFAYWQLFIFTYSKAWFERLKDRLKPSGWASSWKAVVLREDRREQETSPRVVVEESGDRLQMAMIHLRRKDYHGAAVYARSALEGICHQTCAKGSIPIPHVDSIKDRKLEHFLDALETRLGELVDEVRRKTALRLLARLREAKMFVLNRNAHFDVEDEDVLSADVGAAIAVVKDFDDFLASQQWAKANFVSGRQLPAGERLTASIGAAREAASLGALKQAVGGIIEANDAFWEIYGSRLGVLFPVRAKPSAQEIWKAAKDQNRLSAEADARLNLARPYLFGTIKSKDFNVVKFAEAASALEELAAPPPAQG